MIFYAGWGEYDGPGRLAAFGKAPKATRRGYRIVRALHPGAEAIAAPDDVAFRERYAAQLRETDGPAVARMMLEMFYPSAPVLCIGVDPDERDMLGLAAGWLALSTGIAVLPMPEKYRPTRADPRNWRSRLAGVAGGICTREQMKSAY